MLNFLKWFLWVSVVDRAKHLGSSTPSLWSYVSIFKCTEIDSLEHNESFNFYLRSIAPTGTLYASISTVKPETLTSGNFDKINLANRGQIAKL